MSDDRRKTGKADDIRINVSQDWELAYWTRKFGLMLKRRITRKELRAAVKAVGPMCKDVQRYLKETT